MTSFYGQIIWSDGESIYYSDPSNQYVLDKSTSTWEPKTWNGLTSFSGYQIWTDGNNIYYSRDADQYVLDKSTSTWSQKTWTELTRFDGGDIWTDGEDVYYSVGSAQYVLVDQEAQTSYQVNISSATQTSISKADTAVQKANIAGTTNQISATADISGNGTTLTLDSALTNGANAGNTALQPDDIGALNTSDMNELLALIVDDPV